MPTPTTCARRAERGYAASGGIARALLWSPKSSSRARPADSTTRTGGAVSPPSSARCVRHAIVVTTSGVRRAVVRPDAILIRAVADQARPRDHLSATRTSPVPRRRAAELRMADAGSPSDPHRAFILRLLVSSDHLLLGPGRYFEPSTTCRRVHRVGGSSTGATAPGRRQIAGHRVELPKAGRQVRYADIARASRAGAPATRGQDLHPGLLVTRFGNHIGTTPRVKPARP